MTGEAHQVADGHQSTFFSHALSLAALYGPGPWPGGGYPLPDEDTARQQLMPGSVLDGIQTHHFGCEADPEVAAEITDLIADLATGVPSLRSCAALHAALADQSALRLADPLGEQVRRRIFRLTVCSRWDAGWLSTARAVTRWRPESS